VVATNIFQDVFRDVVVDLVFILPLAEVESGNVFITGAANLFFVRYLIDRATHSNFSSVNFLSAHFIQPLTVRIFSSLNTLAFTVKKLMYHRPEAEDTKRSMRIFFPSDAFNYIAHKLQDASIVKCRISKKSTRYQVLRRFEVRVSNKSHRRYLLTSPNKVIIERIENYFRCRRWDWIYSIQAI